MWFLVDKQTIVLYYDDYGHFIVLTSAIFISKAKNHFHLTFSLPLFRSLSFSCILFIMSLIYTTSNVSRSLNHSAKMVVSYKFCRRKKRTTHEQNHERQHQQTIWVEIQLIQFCYLTKRKLNRFCAATKRNTESMHFSAFAETDQFDFKNDFAIWIDE